jgi:hypothetical protein
MVNNVIDNNTGISHAGGIWFSGEDDQIFLFNNTIVNNHSNENGGGVSVEFETANSVFNAHSNIILNNSADLLGDDLYIDNNPYGDPVPNGTVNLLNNDLNLTSGFYIEDNNPSYLNLSNNLDNVNPQFGPDGYHLTDSSPLINAGTSQDAPDYDIDGDSRPQDAAYDIGADEFIALDLDIARCTTTKRVSIGGKKDTVEITLAVVNAGTANSGKTCPANVIGMQDSVEVYNETMGVSDQIGKGKTIFQFPDYIPDAVGEIFWTATINDDDPDADVAVASTVVTP